MTQSNNNGPEISPNRSLLLIIATVCFIALIVLMMFSGNQSALALDNDRMLVTQNTRVQAAEISIQTEYQKPRSVYGQVESVQQSDIGFELAGTLKNLVVLEGASVKQGDLLAQLDIARLQARKNELESALASAQANAKLAQLSQRRIKQLVENRLEPQQRLDEAQAELDAANALTQEAKARLSSLQVELAKSALIAPFDGQVVRQYVDNGTVVNAGQAIFSILAKTNLEARFGLPEQTAFGIRENATYMLNIGGSLFPAQVKSVSKQRSMSTRTIDAVMTINMADLSPMQQQLMVAGDLVSLTVDIVQQKKGAWVPLSALATGIRGMWTLYVVSDNQSIETRVVSIEYADDVRAYVSGAISNGDKVVVNGIHRLTPQQKVNDVDLVKLEDSGALMSSITPQSAEQNALAQQLSSTR
jgi:RND family efflux transporter MFP subunit